MNSEIICGLVVLWSILQLSFGSQMYLRNGNLYLFSNPETMTWHGAMRYCRNNSMELVDVPNAMENDIILNLIKEVEVNYNIIGQSKGYWTSGTDLAETDHFYWATNGRAFQFTYWEMSQPSNWRGREHCVEYRSNYNFKWNDEYCNSKIYAICNNHTIFNTFEPLSTNGSTPTLGHTYKIEGK